MNTFIKSPLLEKAGVKHLFTTTDGGVSEGVFKSMNLAAGSGEITDSPENVIKNHEICANSLGFTANDVVKTRQMHTLTVETVDSSHKGTGISRPLFDHGVDGCVTKEVGVVLTARGADCPPILACDPKNRVIGAVHSGWKGTVGNISAVMIEKMTALGAKPESILVAIGPSIKSCCYEVSSDLFFEFSKAGYGFALKRGAREGKFMLDLTAVLKFQLEENGVLPQNTDILPYCTCCDNRFFSHRRLGINRGTGGGMIVIQ